jgi:hypothetical protein
MPIVIVGTGRCGTSMVTRILSLCGMHIGKSSEMFNAANSNNPTGYWEHRSFLEINDEILRQFGGNELLPPNFPDEWQKDPSLDPLVESAKAAIQHMSIASEIWGWKDPRTSLTLPFWQQLIPDLKVVVCIRNPLEVIRSFEDLLKGYGAIGSHVGTGQGYINWHTFTGLVISNTTSSNRTFTFYEDYFPDYHKPLSDLLNFVGLPNVEPGSTLEDRLSALHDPSLKHHNKTLEDLLESPVAPNRVKDLYVTILNSKSDPAASEPALQKAAAQVSVLPKIDAEFYDEQRIQQIVRDCVLLETRSRQLEEILASRSHRLAARLCALLIWREELVNHAKTAIADGYNNLLANIDKKQKIPRLRWY